jgi:RNA polymerase sigma factor (sigma-70 family)
LRPGQAGLIAERLKVAERDVVDMNQRLQGDVSLNAPVHHDEDKAGDALDWLVDPAPTQEMTFAEQQETAYRHQALKSAIATLNPRERRIFTARRLTDGPPTLEELAAEHGVSRERVRQIEQRAFKRCRLRCRVTGAAPTVSSRTCTALRLRTVESYGYGDCSCDDRQHRCGKRGALRGLAGVRLEHRPSGRDDGLWPKAQPGFPTIASAPRGRNRRRSMTGAQPKEHLLWLCVRRPTGESATTMASPTNLLRRMT